MAGEEGVPEELLEPLLIAETEFVHVEEGDVQGKSAAALIGQIEALWRLISSGALFPDALRGHPHARPVGAACLVLFLALPIKLYLLLVVVGFVLGYAFMVPEGSRHYAGLQDRYRALEGREPAAGAAASAAAPSLSISPRIDAALEVLVERLVGSLIDPWFMPQNRSGQREFQACVKTAIDAALMNLKTTVSGLGKDSLTLYLYGLTNALIVHMQEFKAFGRAGGDARAFLGSAEARRTFFPSARAEAGHFRSIVAVLLRRLLPRQEARSIIVVSLLKEVLASGALWGALDRVCDPDFVNLRIVEGLKEKSDLAQKLEPGWSLVVLKVIKGAGLPAGEGEGGLYCLIHIAGRKVKTRRVQAGASPIWNESYQFKVSDSVLSHMRIHVQLLRYSFVGPDASLGFAKVSPEPVASAADAKQHWLAFSEGQVFVETFILSGGEPAAAAAAAAPAEVGLPAPGGERRGAAAAADLTIDAIFANNELFMEFHEYLNEFKAPPYLQFFMNYDAFRQFTAMELGVDPAVPEAIDNYFRYRRLVPAQIEQLKMIKLDAMDLFNGHFAGDTAKYAVAVSEPLLVQLQTDLRTSDRVDDGLRFCGTGPIGPNLFLPVHRWVYGVLKEVYFAKFKESEMFQRYCQRNDFSTSQYTFGDDLRGGDTEAGVCSGDTEAGLHTEPAESDSLDTKKTSTAICILKQQLAVLEDKLEAVPKHGGEHDALLRTKRDLERQVGSLVSLVRARDTPAHAGNDYWLDLRDVAVRVTPSGLADGASLWAADPVFDVEVLRPAEQSDPLALPAASTAHSETLPVVSAAHPETLSVVSKAYSDFEALHRHLRREFPKMAKVPLPPVAEGPEALERYLQLAISDEFVRQAPILREFASLDSDLEAKGAGHMVEAVVGKTVKNVLQTATSILSAGMLGPSKKKSTFYETREHHTTSDLSQHAEPVDELSRSRSMSSLPRDSPRMAALPTKSSPATPVKAPRLDTARPPAPSPAIFRIDEFTEAEIDMLLETVYTFITETFDLREPNQWIRRKVLSVSKQVLKQAYGETLSKAVSDAINNGLKEEAWLRYIDEATKALWPNGVFIKDIPPPVRSADQQLATQIEARALFLNHIPDVIEKLAGRYNAINGMTRIFNLLQHKDFNKLLFITVLDISVKVLFTE